MAFDPNPPPVAEVSQLILERQKVANRAHLGPQVLHDMKIETVMDHMLDRMLVQLSSHVYAHKVDAQDVRVPFCKTETAPAARGLLWAFGPLVLIATALSLALGSLSLFLVACAVALATVAVYALNSPVTLTARGEAVVHRELFNSFPDNGTVYPKDLGTPVRIATVNSWPEYLR